VFHYLEGAGLPDLGTNLFPLLLHEGRPMRIHRRARPLVVVDTPQQYRDAVGAWSPL
jgi:hypothetical protein